MKIVITGSLGHISKPLAEELVQEGHTITVISSNLGKQKDIETLGATAAIGSIEDVEFLTTTFTGADAVYCMVPPNFAESDQVAYYRKVGNNYATAIQQSGVMRTVHLSSYGAHLEKGTGFIVGSYNIEQLLNTLPGVAVMHIRPGYFYYNLYNFVNMIKAAGIMGANYGGEDRLLMVAPADIASAIAEAIVTPFSGIEVRYVASDDRTCNEVANVLGNAIGKPDLQWVTLSDEQMQSGLEANGVPPHIAANLVELGAAIHNGVLREDYEQHKPAMGKVKLEDFASEFAVTFNQE